MQFILLLLWLFGGHFRLVLPQVAPASAASSPAAVVHRGRPAVRVSSSLYVPGVTRAPGTPTPPPGRPVATCRLDPAGCGLLP
jgi:hypothetical protein